MLHVQTCVTMAEIIKKTILQKYGSLRQGNMMSEKIV